MYYYYYYYYYCCNFWFVFYAVALFHSRSPIPVSVSELVRENDDGLAENDINKSAQYT